MGENQPPGGFVQDDALDISLREVIYEGDGE
jgi:hypothetical protein